MSAPNEPDDYIDQGGTRRDLKVEVQGAFVAAPAALTTTTIAAVTSAQISGGESPTEAEYNALQADVVALRTKQAALLADVTALRTTLAATLVSLKAGSAEGPMASS